MLPRDNTVLRLLGLCSGLFLAGLSRADAPLPVRTVFVIVMENHNWTGTDSVLGVTNCPYLNHLLLPMASYCDQYYNPPSLHPSEPNYLWLESGTNWGIRNDSPTNRIHSTNHLVTLLKTAGISWKGYHEDLGANASPLTDQNNYVVRHNPMVLFTDVDTNLAYMSGHVRPYSELAADLQNHTVARYNFIVPNLTNDMHNAPCSGCSSRVAGDAWLSREMPRLLGSSAYSNSGAIFITWDEGTGSTSDGPIGMILLSPLAKGHAYSNTVHYTHSSLLRTLQNIFGVRPYLGDAANATDLSDLFLPAPLASGRMASDGFHLSVTNLTSGKTTYIQVSTNLVDWVSIRTNVPSSGGLSFTDVEAASHPGRFYRVSETP